MYDFLFSELYRRVGKIVIGWMEQEELAVVLGGYKIKS